MKTPIATINVDAVIAGLAVRYRGAGGVGMQVLNLIGEDAETLLTKLPDPVRDALGQATRRGLEVAMSAAASSRAVVSDQKDWLNAAMAATVGAFGGAGGLPSALAELPVTTTVLMRAIQGIAAEHGFDPDDADVQKHCLTVFASAGPMIEDNGIDMAFLAARIALTGATVHGIILRVAPRLAVAMGQKLAAQGVPVIGAAAGAAVNFAFTNYYQDMARVQFGLLALARETGYTHETLVERLRQQLISE
ncbi:MAG: EcsC family protein [Paracoccaceae bacterium]